MIELRDLPTEDGRESVPVSRTLLSRQNPEFRFLALRWTVLEKFRKFYKVNQVAETAITRR
jgi:hypothetical protein